MPAIHCLADRADVAARLAAAGLAGEGLAGPGSEAAVVIAAIDDAGDLLRERRQWPRAALLALARDEPAMIALLDAGAEDVAAHDASAPLVVARASALLARCGVGPIRVGDLVIDRIARRAERAGRALGLLPREYALLLHLALHAGEIVTRSALLSAVWGLGFDPGTNVVEVHVSRLRARLDRGFDRPLLVTVKDRGATAGGAGGYRLG